jgi:tRNA(Ile)-lysidine synthase TilS/MesJ
MKAAAAFCNHNTWTANEIKYSRNEIRNFFFPPQHAVTCVCVYTKRQRIVKFRNIVYMTHSTARKDVFESLKSKRALFVIIYIMVVFRLSPCLECSLCSFGKFPKEHRLYILYFCRNFIYIAASCS